MPSAIPSVDESFLEVVRHALNDLYDPERLRNSALIGWLPVEGHLAVGARLQHILLDAIQAMRAPANEPATSMRRRIHQVLQLRYEQQFAQKEVALQLGLSVRQYRRLQQAAVEALAFHLWEKYDLDLHFKGASGDNPPATGDAAETPELPASLQWLNSLSATETTELWQVLPELLRLVEPLATRNARQVVLHGDGGRCRAALHPLVFRQAVLHLLNTAILHTTGHTVHVTVSADRWQVTLSVSAPGPRDATRRTASAPGTQEEMVQQMLQASQASLVVLESSHAWQAFLTCSCIELSPLLVVDDHLETTALLQRCTEGTRYRLVVCHEPTRALEMAQEQRPLLILLDVMMPDVDGWEVLSRLKQHEATASIPVWVCTVLDQAELAMSLGADGFLRKPVTRQALLALLDAQARAPAPAPP